MTMMFENLMNNKLHTDIAYNKAGIQMYCIRFLTSENDNYDIYI